MFNIDKESTQLMFYLKERNILYKFFKGSNRRKLQGEKAKQKTICNMMHTF